MKKHNNFGFTVVEILLFIGVTLVLIGVGYYAYNRNFKPNNLSGSPTSQVAENADPSSEDSYKGWKEYKSDVISFRYPENWNYIDVVIDPEFLSSIYISNEQLPKNTEIKPGTTYIGVTIFKKGYYIGNIGENRQLLDDSITVEYFARAMNGLLPEEEFNKTSIDKRLISGKEAVTFVGYSSIPWTIKANSNMYEFEIIKGQNPITDNPDIIYQKFLDSIVI